MQIRTSYCPEAVMSRKKKKNKINGSVFKRRSQFLKKVGFLHIWASSQKLPSIRRDMDKAQIKGTASKKKITGKLCSLKRGLYHSCPGDGAPVYSLKGILSMCTLPTVSSSSLLKVTSPLYDETRPPTSRSARVCCNRWGHQDSSNGFFPRFMQKSANAPSAHWTPEHRTSV